MHHVGDRACKCSMCYSQHKHRRHRMTIAVRGMSRASCYTFTFERLLTADVYLYPHCLFGGASP